MKTRLGVLVALLCGIATIGTGIVNVTHTPVYTQTAQISSTATLEGTSMCATNVPLQWYGSQSGALCRGYTINNGVDGTQATIENTTTGFEGRGYHVCINGEWALDTTRSSSCYPLQASQYCPSGERVRWGENDSCEAFITTALQADNTFTVVNTNVGFEGEARLLCDATGIWRVSSTDTFCKPEGPTHCEAKNTISWTQNGNTCSASLAETPVETSRLVTDTGSPTTGSATFECRLDGTWASTPSNSLCSTYSYVDEYPACPFESTTNAYLFDFTNGKTKGLADLVLWANQGESLAKRLYTGSISSIPAGVYKVELATNWSPSFSQGEYPQQEWKVRLRLTDGSYVWSGKTTDTNSTVVQLTNQELTIPLASRSVDAYHAAYPHSVKNPVVPVCARFTHLRSLTPTSVEPDKVDGVCDSATRNNCLRGDFSDIDDTSTLFLWKCKGDSGGADATCSLRRASSTTSIVDAQCGSMNNVCIHGIPTDVSDSENEYLWYCKGEGGGTDAPLCKVKKAGATSEAGVCGETIDTCKAGEFKESLDTVTEHRWQCRGINGGADSSCLAPRQAPVGTSIEPNDNDPDRIIVNNEVVYEKETVTVSSEAIGLSRDDIDVQLPIYILDARRTVVVQATTTPFRALNDAPPELREQLVRTWLQSASSEGDSPQMEDDGLLPELTRRSQESTSDNEVDTRPQVTQDEIKKVVLRSGLATLRDRDGDGISDYDEEHLYGTDPNDPFTSNSLFTDGERVLLGMNPTTDDLTPVVVDSPKILQGVIEDTLYSIETITLEHTQVEGEEDSSSVRITGKTKPFAFLTLYIYSTPIIVTIRADASGNFEYILDKTLENGEHELYVAAINNAGRILAQTSPIPFVKTAQAIEYTPASVSASDPVGKAANHMLIFSLLVVLCIAVLGIVWIGRHHGRPEEAQLTSNELSV